MASFYGMRRRGAPLDPFSDEARFPSLAEDAQARARSTFGDLQTAGMQHLAALADGPNSIAARNDPLRYGSIFSRQHPGAFDAFRDQQRQQDDAGLARRTVAPAASELSATDRYAARFANPAADAAQPATSVAAQGFGGHNPGRLNRRSVNGVLTFDDY